MTHNCWTEHPECFITVTVSQDSTNHSWRSVAKLIGNRKSTTFRFGALPFLLVREFLDRSCVPPILQYKGPSLKGWAPRAFRYCPAIESSALAFDHTEHSHQMPVLVAQQNSQRTMWHLRQCFIAGLWQNTDQLHMLHHWEPSPTCQQCPAKEWQRCE
jgi:hypothetical protein